MALEVLSALQWTPYQGGADGTLIAQVNLDSSIQQAWAVPITGIYQNQSVIADGVIVYNTKNNGVVDIVAGTLITDIPPFTRDYVQLGQSAGNSIAVNFTVGSIALLFYRGTPPVNPSLINYAGAQAVANSNVFIGDTTTGTPNAQVLTTSNSQNYSFTNGVLICATAGFTNTGALIIAINGTGGVPVNKPSPNGPVPCTGGEFVEGQNFLLAVNTTTSSFDLLSNYGAGIVTEFILPNDVAINNATFTTGPQLNVGTSGNFEVNVSCLFQDGVGGAFVQVILTDGTTVFASTQGYTNGTQGFVCPLTAKVSNPAGPLLVQAKSSTATTQFSHNASGFGKDCMITAQRAA